VFSFREVFSDDGIINRGAVASIPNGHVVVGQNDIYLHDGSQKRSIVDNKVRRTFFNDLSDTRSVFCQTNPDTTEVYICYADDSAADSQSANRALVYNWTQDAFTFIDLPNARALAVADRMDTSGNYTNSTASWNTSTDYWSNVSLGTQANNIKLFAADSVDNTIRMMNDTTGLSGSPMPAYLEATKIDLDQVLGQSTRNIKQINGIMPQIEGTGTVRVQVGVSDAPQDGIRWQVDKTFNIESDHKIDFRTSGRYFALRIESNSATDYWNLTGLDIDVQEVAGR